MSLIEVESFINAVFTLRPQLSDAEIKEVLARNQTPYTPP